MNTLIREFKVGLREGFRLYFLPITAAVRVLRRLARG